MQLLFLFLVSKVPVRHERWCDHGPGVETGAEPRGDDLDPHGAVVGLVVGQVGRRAVKRGMSI